MSTLKRPGMGSHHATMAGKDEWLTPPEMLNALGAFDLDPCAPVNRPWSTAVRHLTVHDDGLLRPWRGRVWCNPPYGNATGLWLARCAAHRNATALVFARTETVAWHEHVWPAADSILFLAGRLRFHHVSGRRSVHSCGAPSALIAYDAANTTRLAASGLPGRLVRLGARIENNLQIKINR